MCFASLPPEPWVQAVQQALPQAHVYAWTPGAPQADHAIVWAPPQQFIDEQSGLQTLFNIGAGVDALLGDVAGQLQMLFLVLPHRHPIGVIEKDVGGHQHGIVQ